MEGGDAAAAAGVMRCSRTSPGLSCQDLAQFQGLLAAGFNGNSSPALHPDFPRKEIPACPGARFQRGAVRKCGFPSFAVQEQEKG